MNRIYCRGVVGKEYLIIITELRPIPKRNTMKVRERHMKEEIFSKFRDYNNELEKILEKKDFSKDSKSLLLSMFYKLEISYSDYETVKRKVKTKQEYLENILENIKTCNKIQLVKPNTKEFKEFQEKKINYEVDLKLKKIKVIDNELNLLTAILELNDFKIYLEEKYNLIRNAFPYLLNTASDMENTEVLRDFNAFSWNISIEEIENIYIHLVYENLKIALSIDIIDKLKSTNEIIDLIELIKNNLKEQYEEEVADKFLNLLLKIAIIIYIQKSSFEKKRLSEEKETIEEELKHIKNKKVYVNDVINNKLELTKKVKELDLILNNKELLIKEYEKRNHNKSNYHQFFSLSHLAEKLQRDREKAISKIAECNQKLEPNQYIVNKQKIQNDFNLLKGIRFEEDKDNTKLLYKQIDELQELFLKEILPKKIQSLTDKEELIDMFYILRYYHLMPYSDTLKLNEIEKFEELFMNNFSTIIKKMYQLKLINTISTNEEMDIKIVSNLFNLYAISLEEIYLELTKDGDKYRLNIYDDKDTFEQSVEMELDFHKKDKVKFKRKVKLF